MGIPLYCKHCFRGLKGKFISDKFLLMSKDNYKCDSCEHTDEPVVLQYFPFGEHTVTLDGKRIVGAGRHVGVNPNYSFFEPCSIYPERERNLSEKESS